MRRLANMNVHYTAKIFKDGDWWVGFVEEVPGVLAQEKTKSELIESLQETLSEMLDVLRADAQKMVSGKKSEEIVLA